MLAHLPGSKQKGKFEALQGLFRPNLSGFEILGINIRSEFDTKFTLFCHLSNLHQSPGYKVS